ncbi:MAG: 50S ribosomal protein L11 methyltransferase [Acidobacteriota bacterium]
MRYTRRIFEVPEEQEESLSAALWRLGSLGCEIKPGRERGLSILEAWFEEGREPDAEELSSRQLGPRVRELLSEAVADRDWLETYRAQCRPFDVGQRFRVDPRDEAEEPPPGRVLLHVPAENAFGTGSHESTRLMLRWLEEIDLAGRRVLDAGTGSGILAIAAARLGAAEVVGFDLDSPSVITARRNHLRDRARDSTSTGAPRAGGPVSGCAVRFVAATARALVTGPRFDLLLVNVLPERILGDLPRLVATLKPGGALISSGNLLERRDELAARFRSCGLEVEGEKREAEWLSFLLRLREQP